MYDKFLTGCYILKEIRLFKDTSFRDKYCTSKNMLLLDIEGHIYNEEDIRIKWSNIYLSYFRN